MKQKKRQQRVERQRQKKSATSVVPVQINTKSKQNKQNKSNKSGYNHHRKHCNNGNNGNRNNGEEDSDNEKTEKSEKSEKTSIESDSADDSDSDSDDDSIITDHDKIKCAQNRRYLTVSQHALSAVTRTGRTSDVTLPLLLPHQRYNNKLESIKKSIPIANISERFLDFEVVEEKKRETTLKIKEEMNRQRIKNSGVGEDLSKMDDLDQILGAVKERNNTINMNSNDHNIDNVININNSTSLFYNRFVNANINNNNNTNTNNNNTNTLDSLPILPINFLDL